MIELRDNGWGITYDSLHFWQDNKSKLGVITEVDCIFERDTDVTDYNTTITGSDGIMKLSGFACGYGGTGPHGLFKLMQDLDKTVTLQQIASTDHYKWRLVDAGDLVELPQWFQ